MALVGPEYWGGLSPKERRQYTWFHPSSKTGT
ncbi:hypothetical protein M2275_007297 [Rhodococcus opacus]|jgi:hypothetical protein|nr:hypothetical protein [Rhodococcus opacus]